MSNTTETKTRNTKARKRFFKHWHLVVLMLMVYDVFAIHVAYFLALWGRFDFVFSRIPETYFRPYKLSITVYALFCVVVLWMFRLYKSVWRFASFSELIRTFTASVVMSLVYSLCITVFVARMPLTYYFFGAFIQMVMLIAARFSYRFYLLTKAKYQPADESTGRVMLIGAGSAGQMILRDMEMSRGKRLRPRLLLMASRYGSEFQGSRSRLCRLGALVELVHMASLIHDDIVDDAPLRRGMPTTQSKYGKDMAVYAGDLILSRIVQSLFRDGFMRVGAYFGDTVEAMCLGELGQMEYRGREDITVDQYMSNIYGKTAALCRLACVAGAVESGCSDEVTSQLEQLGINFGYMFQIRDDLLDFISTSAEEGKPTQVDFREGIYTLPVIYAMQDAGSMSEAAALGSVAIVLIFICDTIVKYITKDRKGV